MKYQNNWDSSWWALTKFVWQLGGYETSSPATKELHEPSSSSTKDIHGFAIPQSHDTQSVWPDG